MFTRHIRRGILHVHSNYSYDGENSLEEIVSYARRRGYAFVGLTEHADTFDHEKMAAYLEHCHRLSTPECLLIRGLEFRCGGGLHLLGLGVHEYTDVTDPVRLTDFIRRRGGMSIIAHPIRHDYRVPPGLSATADGIEVWNAAYDGRFVPNDTSLALLRRLRRDANRSLLAFGAQDLHRITSRCNVEITVASEELSEASIVAALRERPFTISNPSFRLHSREEVDPASLALIRVARRLYRLGRVARHVLATTTPRWLTRDIPR